MIRDVVVHLLNEQPVVADMYEMPTAGDSGFVCTNLRTLDGRRPVFVDQSDSTFFFPYQHIRFVEIPSEPSVAPTQHADVGPAVPEGAGAPDSGAEIDVEFLRRIREA